MIGDSITDANRNYEAEAAGWASHGEGYVNLVNAFLTGCCSDKQVMVVNKGVNGNTIRHLKERWNKDVLAYSPDWVSIMIGVNDAWRHFDGVLTQVDQVSFEEYEATYRELIEETKKQGAQVIVIAPCMFEPNKEDKMRQMVCKYASIAEKVAKEYGTIFVDTQKDVDEYLENLSPYLVTQDRVHPNVAGHMIIARAFMKAIEFEW